MLSWNFLINKSTSSFIFIFTFLEIIPFVKVIDLLDTEFLDYGVDFPELENHTGQVFYLVDDFEFLN